MPKLFDLGQTVATPGALELGVDLSQLILRHASGDWGDLCEEDKAQNEVALKDGSRIMSAYITPMGKLWIITESDRSSTCVLKPEEY
jgi:hypothetical protein